MDESKQVSGQWPFELSLDNIGSESRYFDDSETKKQRIERPTEQNDDNANIHELLFEGNRPSKPLG